MFYELPSLWAQSSPTAWAPGWGSFFLALLLGITSVILMIVVLIQRGKGGGLVGAFGGAGGSSAFGSRAGDLFTRITIVIASIWIVLVMITIKATQPTEPKPQIRGIESVPTAPADTGD